MAGKRPTTPRTEHETPYNRTDPASARQVAALFPPPQARPPSAAEAERAVRLLIVCNTTAERLVVAFHVYHRRTLDDVAGLVGIGGNEARDLYAGVRGRLDADERQRRNGERLARANGPAPAARKEKE